MMLTERSSLLYTQSGPPGYPDQAGYTYPHGNHGYAPAGGGHYSSVPSNDYNEYAQKSYHETKMALSSSPVDIPTYQGEMASEDVLDDPAKEPPQPTMPPLDAMDRIQGYEHVTFNPGFLPPPPFYDDAKNEPAHKRPTPKNEPAIDEKEARDALAGLVAQHCCYGTGVLQSMTFQEIKCTSAFHYTLESFTETRSVCWTYEPYNGQRVDSAMKGHAPAPWDITGRPRHKFENYVSDVEVPHTASVKPCHHCGGQGRVRCYRCVGRGRVICSSCNGTGRGWNNGRHYGVGSLSHNEIGRHEFGHRHHGAHHGRHHGLHSHHARRDSYGELHGPMAQFGHETFGQHPAGLTHHHSSSSNEFCIYCEGTGRKRCPTCYGHGQTQCEVCQAYGQLKCYIKLTIKWSNHLSDHIVEKTALPSHLVRSVSGQTSFEEEGARVWPVTHFSDPSIKATSKQLMEKHTRQFSNERFIMQRHRVRIVPVTEVIYGYRGKNDYNYFVYGFERKVHCPQYPQSCCCGCVIL